MRLRGKITEKGDNEIRRYLSCENFVNGACKALKLDTASPFLIEDPGMFNSEKEFLPRNFPIVCLVCGLYREKG